MASLGDFTFTDDAVHKSPKYRFAVENAAVVRRAYLPYVATHDNIAAAAITLLGSVVLKHENVLGVERAWVQRTLPHAWPASPTIENPFGDDFLYAASAPMVSPASRANGDDDEGRASYDWYAWDVTYEPRQHGMLDDSDVLPEGPYSGANPLGAFFGPPNFAARPDEGNALQRGWRFSRFVTKQFDPASRTITLPQGQARYVAQEGKADQAVGQGLAMVESRALLTYTHHCLPERAVPATTLLNSYGCVSRFDFDGYPAGTLLFEDPKLRYYTTATGQRVCDLTIRLIYKPNFDRSTTPGRWMGHNSAHRVMDGRPRYWPVSTDGLALAPDESNWIHPTTDLANFFRPDYPYVA